MNGLMDSTRGFERLDPHWHSRVDEVESVEDVVKLTRDYVATLTPELLAQLPERCRPLRVKAEDDIEYWTFRLSAAHGDKRANSALLHNLFMHFLHASLRVAQIHRARAQRVLDGAAFTDGVG